MNTRNKTLFVSVAALTLASACAADVSLGHNDGKATGSGATGSTDDGAGGAASGPDAAPPASGGSAGEGAIAELLHATWMIEPGGEAYYCTRQTLTTALDIQSIRVATAAGTHDFELSAGAPSGADGTDTCLSTTPDAATSLASSAIGESVEVAVSGAASHLSAGEQVLLRLHLVNTTVNVESGDTVVEAH